MPPIAWFISSSRSSAERRSRARLPTTTRATLWWPITADTTELDPSSTGLPELPGFTNAV